jgi:hypothetical protein
VAEVLEARFSKPGSGSQVLDLGNGLSVVRQATTEIFYVGYGSAQLTVSFKEHLYLITKY